MQGCLLSLFIVAICLNGSFALDHDERRVRNKRDLPLKLDCDVRSTDENKRCYKGDLVDVSVADCDRSDSFIPWTCDPVDDQFASTTTDVADPSKHGISCNPAMSKPVVCGTMNTRCVCDAPFDFTSPLRRPYDVNTCRCQYWPAKDVRTSRTSVCRQYDHGSTSGVHFYACCDNCRDSDTSCNGDTYQGGGTTLNLCSECGNRAASEQSSRLTYTFNCGGCSQQHRCKQHCDDEYPLAKVLPGLCPKWIGCFRGCCLRANPANRGKR